MDADTLRDRTGLVGAGATGAEYQSIRSNAAYPSFAQRELICDELGISRSYAQDQYTFADGMRFCTWAQVVRAYERVTGRYR
jgi:hypothetical protein